jgi:hypothetical protein
MEFMLSLARHSQLATKHLFSQVQPFATGRTLNSSSWNTISRATDKGRARLTTFCHHQPLTTGPPIHCYCCNGITALFSSAFVRLSLSPLLLLESSSNSSNLGSYRTTLLQICRIERTLFRLSRPLGCFYVRAHALRFGIWMRRQFLGLCKKKPESKTVVALAGFASADVLLIALPSGTFEYPLQRDRFSFLVATSTGV